MATLTAKLVLTSTVTSDTLNVTATEVLTVTDPLQGLSKVAIEGSGGSDTTLVASSASIKYVYIKHTGLKDDGTATTAEVVVDFGTTDSIRLSTGEFTFFPAKASTAITGIASGLTTIVVEYAYWTKG